MQPKYNVDIDQRMLKVLFNDTSVWMHFNILCWTVAYFLHFDIDIQIFTANTFQFHMLVNRFLITVSVLITVYQSMQASTDTLQIFINNFNIRYTQDFTQVVFL